MPKPINSGTQKRTIKCGCGKVMIGQPNRLDTLFKLHRKVCPNGTEFKCPLPSTVPFENMSNTASSGISLNKRGNPSVCKEVVSVGYCEDTPLGLFTIKK